MTTVSNPEQDQQPSPTTPRQVLQYAMFAAFCFALGGLVTVKALKAKCVDQYRKTGCELVAQPIQKGKF